MSLVIEKINPDFRTKAEGSLLEQGFNVSPAVKEFFRAEKTFLGFICFKIQKLCNLQKIVDFC